MRIYRIVLISILAPGLLGLMGWNLTQASRNAKDIIIITGEYKVLLSALLRIEQGVIKINGKQEAFTTKLSQMNTAQKLTNQNLLNHITMDNKRTETIERCLNRHLYKTRGIE